MGQGLAAPAPSAPLPTLGVAARRKVCAPLVRGLPPLPSHGPIAGSMSALWVPARRPIPVKPPPHCHQRCPHPAHSPPHPDQRALPRTSRRWRLCGPFGPAARIISWPGTCRTTREGAGRHAHMRLCARNARGERERIERACRRQRTSSRHHAACAPSTLSSNARR